MNLFCAQHNDILLLMIRDEENSWVCLPRALTFESKRAKLTVLLGSIYAQQKVFHSTPSLRKARDYFSDYAWVSNSEKGCILDVINFFLIITTTTLFIPYLD